MSISKLETFVPRTGVGKPRSKVGFLWDKFTKPAAEPPFRPLPEYHIRVVKIKPGTAQHPLRVKLKVVDPRKFNYIALSYTWEADDVARFDDRPSHATGNHTILCGGSPIRVTKNLYDALSQIRDVQSEVPLFVDALCINLEDNAERTAYLEIMGHVYARAASVIVFLGPKAAYTEETMFIMRKLVNAVDWRKITSDGSYSFRNPRLFEQLGMEPPTLKQWRQMHAFCHVGWFSRRWAFFELALAQQPLFLWGECCMEYNFLIDFGMILGLSGWLEELAHSDPDVGTQGPAGLTNMLGPVARLRSTPPWHPKHKDHIAWMKTEYGLETEQQRAWKFFEILLQSAEAFQCRDPRDVVYAPLAFARTTFAGQPINKQWPCPDYSRRPEEVLGHFRNLIQLHTGKPSTMASISTIEQSTPHYTNDHDARGTPSRRRMPFG